jgi:hypothetical protein
MRYEILIDAAVPPAALHGEFSGLEPDLRTAQTVLSGAVLDEAQLYSLLVRLQEFGLHVTELRRLPD